MKATTIKQIKFNRGQVSDLLSERVDMGLQNACGTVYDNMYINRYGQLQNAPTPILNCDFPLANTERLLCMFDTGTNKVFPITVNTVGGLGSYTLNVYRAVSKTDKYFKTDFSLPIASATISGNVGRALQFGYNVLFYGQNLKPWLINLTTTDNWETITLTVKDTYFDGAFDNIYVRGLNIETPTGFTVPTSGWYKIQGVVITTKAEITLKRNGAGGNFTTDLVGQVLLCRSNGGSLQVVKFVDSDTLRCRVLSPLTALDAAATDIDIPFDGSTEWVFGYVRAYGDTASPTGSASYPDSAIFTNQRLIFGGNDYHGNLLSASRVGVINDFDPESATESDSFTTAIASKDFCRIVALAVSNNELRLCCTNGEYAMSLANLTPSGSLNGFDLRSEIGVATGTAVCDCGGVIVSVSHYRDALYGTQFSLLRDRYQPISLTSQTSNIVNNCLELVYLTNRANSEGNCLVGRNGDYSMFGMGVDINSGVIGAWKINKFSKFTDTNTSQIHILNLFQIGECLWAEVAFRKTSDPSILFYGRHLVRFSFGEMFALPHWFRYYPQGEIPPLWEKHPNELVVNGYVRQLATNSQSSEFKAFYYNETTKEYEFITPTGYTYSDLDGMYIVNFADDIIQKNIVCAGFVRQADWRSVEIGVGMATRELNKRIVKLEGVIEPTQITGYGRFAGLVLTPEEAKNFITLTKSKDVEEMDVDNLSNTSYTETQDLVWRRAFDNPDRELHFGVSMVAPFLVKSITATISYDEVS